MNVSTNQGVLGPVQLGIHGLWGDDARASPPIQNPESPLAVKIVHSDIQPTAEEISLMKSMREVLRSCEQMVIDRESGNRSGYHVEPIPDIYMVHRHFTAVEKRQIRDYIVTLRGNCQQNAL
ncbi:hypothetical protein [Sphingomonas sp. RT2P30]|uniref:hypothetical protein n=1 Tax=Parasphingomonas halimpatiens TaxID=3096162 RepID=UPI002FCAC7CE